MKIRMEKNKWSERENSLTKNSLPTNSLLESCVYVCAGSQHVVLSFSPGIYHIQNIENPWRIKQKNP